MKEDLVELIESHILRDLLWYEKKKVPWTDQLYELSKKRKVDLTTGQIETLVKTLNQLSQDENEIIRQKAVSSLANFAMKSEEFVSKCADMDVLEHLHNSFFDYNAESQAGVFALLGSFCRLCRSEDVVYVVTKLNLLDFVLSCVASLDEHLVVAAAKAMHDMVLHVKLTLDLATKGLFDSLALVIMDDLAGALARTAPVVALVRRASEHNQPVPHTIVKSGCLGLIAHFVYHPDLRYQKLALENSRMQTLLMLENGLLEALLFNLQTTLSRTDPSLTALDNVLSSSLEVTERFVDLKGHLILSVLLHQNCSEFVLFAIIKIFTDIFNRGEPYNTLIANLDIYPRLVELYRQPSSSQYMRSAVSNSCKQFLDECTDWQLIKAFFKIAPQKQLVYVIPHFSEILPKSLEERKSFLDMNGLWKVLQFTTIPGDPLDQYVETIKACFPADVVNFYTPGFQETICSQVDNFSGLTSKYIHFMSRYKKKERRGSEIEEEDDRS